jgi:hypothetical protein
MPATGHSATGFRRFARLTGFSLWILTAAVAFAQSSPEVVLFVRSLASTLTQAHDADGVDRPDAMLFLDHFDPNMPGYAELRDDVESLITEDEVGSSIEILTDNGTHGKRVLELDWILEIPDQQPRRKLVTCTIERKKKDWKITGFNPIDFFKN